MKIVENKIAKGSFRGGIAYVKLIAYWDDDETIREMLAAGPIVEYQRVYYDGMSE